MIDIIKKRLDWAEKFFKRFKAFGYIIAILFAIVYFTSQGYNKKEAIRIAERLTGLNIERDILIGEKDEAINQRNELLNDISISIREKDSIQKNEIRYKKLSYKYRKERDDAFEKLKDTPLNESYDFLHNIVFPFSGEDEFGFNANQVTAIHEVVIQNKYCEKELIVKNDQLNNCKEELATTEDISNGYEKAMEKSMEETAYSDSISAINEEIAEISIKQWKKERRKKRWNKIKTPVIAVGSFIFGALVTK